MVTKPENIFKQWIDYQNIAQYMNKINTLARGLRLPMASALKSFLFFLHSTAVMMIIMSVTTEIGAKTAAIIQRLLGGFLTTAEKNLNKLLFYFLLFLCFVCLFVFYLSLLYDIQ